MELAISSNAIRNFELLAAVREGRGDDILRILGQDPTLIHETDPAGDNALHVVARGSDTELVRQLVRFVKSHRLTKVLMERNSQGNTPLHLAAMKAANPAVYHLLNANTDAISIVNEDGMSPWDVAAEIGGYKRRSCSYAFHSDIEMEIIYRAIHESLDENTGVGPSPDEQHKAKASTELSLAVKQGEEDLVQRILEEDPTLIWYKDEESRIGMDLIRYKLNKRQMQTALHDAAKAGRVGMLRLIAGFMIPYQPLMSSAIEGNKTDKSNSVTPLHLAISKGHMEAARYLIQLSPKVAYKINYRSVSPLHLAVEKGHADLVRYIFQVMPFNEISPSIKDDLYTAQMKNSLANAAIKTGNLGILEAIVKELPNMINIPDHKGRKPLSYAAYKGFLGGVCHLLHKFPAYVRKYDSDGSLPIHKAVRGGHVSVVKAFQLHCSKTLYDIDRSGRSVLHFAVIYAKADVLCYLTKQVGVAEIFDLRDDKGKTFIDLAKEIIY